MHTKLTLRERRFTAFLVILYALNDQSIVRHSSATEIQFDEETCLSWGFNPSQLSCDTCQLLNDVGRGRQSTLPHLPMFYDECMTCCQKWRKSSSRIQTTQEDIKYGAAIIAISQSVGGIEMMMMGGAGNMGMGGGRLSKELEEFFQSEEFADIVELKGGEEFIGVQMAPPMQPSVMLLYRDHRAAAVENSKPDEVISLSRWKKEDICDLLTHELADKR